MPVHICTTCGTSFSEAGEPPENCPICEDERQFVPRSGQGWTTSMRLAAGHTNAWRRLEDDLFEIHTAPNFAIGQRALLLRTPHGNILWDCITLFDEATEALVRALGGLAAIAISHPHYYSCMQDWARAFDCPVHLHKADAEWIMRPDSRIRLWDGERLAIAPDVNLLRLGGHYPGGTVLHWADGAGGRGALLTGDIVQVAVNFNRVSFLWSYPNMMPLSGTTVRRIADTLKPWPFDRIYGAFPGRQVTSGGADVVQRSAARYIELLAGEQP